MNAFRIARDVVHHQWINAGATRSASTPSRTAWLWSALQDRGGPRTAAKQAQARAYDRRVRGRNVLTTLDDMARILWLYRGWEIARVDVEQPGHTVGSLVTFDNGQTD